MPSRVAKRYQAFVHVGGHTRALMHVQSLQQQHKTPTAQQAIQEASTLEHLAAASNLLVLPDEINSQQSHLKQHIHQIKRQAAATRALVKAVKLSRTSAQDGQEYCSKLARFARAAALPSTATEDDAADAARCATALHAIASLVAYGNHNLSDHVLEYASQLAVRVDAHVKSLPLSLATQTRWACECLGVDATPEAITFVASQAPFHVSVGELQDALDVQLLADAIPFAKEMLQPTLWSVWLWTAAWMATRRRWWWWWWQMLLPTLWLVWLWTAAWMATRWWWLWWQMLLRQSSRSTLMWSSLTWSPSAQVDLPDDSSGTSE